MKGLYEITKDEIRIPSKYVKDSLNSKIWDGEKMRPEVRKKLLEIAKEYYEYLNISSPIKKIVMTGSLANYNWTDNSDIDLHLIMDFNKVNDDKDFAKEYLSSKEGNWKDKHNIKIYGFDVETYSQDESEKHNSTGVYDIFKNEWIIKPEITDFKINKEEIKNKIQKVVTAIEKFQKESDNKKKYEIGSNLKDKIKKMRQAGLDEKGEFSVENLVFKYLRNEGFLEKLYDETRAAFDATLSLQENNPIIENLKNLYRKESWNQ